MTDGQKLIEELASEINERVQRLMRLSLSEPGGEDVAELWAIARFRAGVAYDEHMRLQRDNDELRALCHATSTDSAAVIPPRIDARTSNRDRISTFTRAHNGEEVRALAASNPARNNRPVHRQDGVTQ
ncbi:hypothetical protein [Nocardioides sambongensis]|uniref:hypothetical protein n=1 Tax=Nocardioides sambongensis TaxID=2589074 RepID=UPI00112BC14D|nr:hypothetical protein [Nocardioides sambongensis]